MSLTLQFWYIFFCYVVLCRMNSKCFKTLHIKNIHNGNFQLLNFLTFFLVYRPPHKPLQCTIFTNFNDTKQNKGMYSELYCAVSLFSNHNNHLTLFIIVVKSVQYRIHQATLKNRNIFFAKLIKFNVIIVVFFNCWILKYSILHSEYTNK